VHQAAHQVLQLLDERPPVERDWRDPDNKLFTACDEYRTLAECGLSPGCSLSLHSLAPSTPKHSPEGGPSSATEGGSSSSASAGALVLPSLCDGCTQHRLVTPITPAQADHSFCGVLFDVHAKTECSLVITSVWVAGMLGRVRVFARPCSWKGPNEADVATRTVNTGWGTRYDIDASLWEQVADETCAPSWDTCREVKLNTPLTVLPHHTIGLYVHSALPDDLGIQYQSYHRQGPFAQDDNMALYPGLGFTGMRPFDTRAGWYRLNRGLTGQLSYFAVPCRWRLNTHSMFPKAVKATVRTLLLCQRREESPLHSLPAHVIIRILESMHWDWCLKPGQTAPSGGFSLEGGGDPAMRATLARHFNSRERNNRPDGYAYASDGESESDEEDEFEAEHSDEEAEEW